MPQLSSQSFLKTDAEKPSNNNFFIQKIKIMKSATKAAKTPKQQTFPVSNEVFKMVYDAPSSLPGKHKWVTTDGDVRQKVKGN